MPRVVMCGTPKEHCSGGQATVNAMLRGASPKIHQNHSQAYRCYRNYLIRVLGYEGLGRREFRPPNGGPIRFLTRKSRFGASLRYGKEQARWMPKEKGRSGVIVKT